MALAYSDITVELREISLKNRPQSLYAVSSKGTVPVLCISESYVLDESLDIMLWALNCSDPENWLDKDQKSQLEIIEVNDNEFKHWLDRYKYSDRYPEYDREYYREKCENFLSTLSQLLITNKYILHNHLALVDIAIFPLIRQFANVDKLWFTKNYQALSIWLNNITETKLFLSIMDKYTENNGEELIINFNFTN